MILLIKLLIAHILGDFVLQPDLWVIDKKQHKYRSKYLYLHVLVHFIALLFLLQFNWSLWPYIVLIAGSHLLIDLTKLYLEKKINSRMLFVADQLLHVLVLSLVVCLVDPFTIPFDQLYTAECLLTILAILLTTFVSSIFMKVILSRWDIEEEDGAGDSLKNAGKYIGILERLFVFGFIVLNHWSAIGLLVTAKSVFRFSDLSRAKDRKLTEYILIGTLMSFGFAIIIGLLYTYCLHFL